ncbi:MAG TPA: hypothetical protein DCZ88_09125 [Pseudanabaena sp.]|nr:hypothetical protein [Pseudanabaena sp.]
MEVMRKLKPCPICGSHRKCLDIMGDLVACMGSPNGEIQLAGYKYCHPDKGQRYGIYEIEKGGE